MRSPASVGARTWRRSYASLRIERWWATSSFFRPALRNWRFLMGSMILAVIFFVGLFPESVAPHPFNVIDIDVRRTPPAWVEGGSLAYLLGTDNFGRDLLTRIIYATRIVLWVACVATAIAAVCGVTMGILSGYVGGIVDTVIMRIVDIQWSFPSLLLAIGVMALFGASIPMLWLVLVITGWVGYARTIRGMVLSLKTEEFVVAARTVGAGDARIMLRHILPNLVGVISVLMSFQLASMTLTEASLSFIGLGVQPPTPSWGGLLSEGRPYLTTSWWLITFPGIALMFIVIGANQLGDALRDLLDPRLRGSL